MSYLQEVADRFLHSVRSAVWPEMLQAEKLEDILSDHADGLIRGESGTRSYLNRLPEERQTLEALLPLAERIHDALYEVGPSQAFQNRLLKDLSCRPHTRDVQSMPSLWQEKRTGLIIGATVGSVLSAAGLAYFVRSHLLNHHASAAGRVPDSSSAN
jgi:hypothetical protein